MKGGRREYPTAELLFFVLSFALSYTALTLSIRGPASTRLILSLAVAAIVTGCRAFVQIALD